MILTKDVYGKKVDVEFIHFIRPEMKFEDVEGLKKQIAGRFRFCKKYVSYWIINACKGFNACVTIIEYVAVTQLSGHSDLKLSSRRLIFRRI